MTDRDFLAPHDVVAPFVTELFTPEGQLAQYHVPESTVLFLPSGIDAPRSFDAALRATVHRCAGSAAIRVDVSPLVTHDHIRLFRRVRRAEAQPTGAPDDFN